MTVFLIPNLKKEQAVAVTSAVITKLRTIGVTVLLELALKPKFETQPVTFSSKEQAFAACDIVITVGGDGTMLHSAHDCMEYGKPLLGINLGRMGFLATVEANELEKLERLIKGDYTIDKRAMLAVEATGRNPFLQHALNDVVLSKTGISQTIDVKIYCDDILVNSYQGDGVVIATPTGSTAYSLSAGGPILDAHIAGIVMTPICAHSLHSPPMVFSAGRKLRVEVDSRTQTNAFISCDGRKDEQISCGDIVKVSLSNQFISLVCFNEADQFEAIDKKLKGRA